MNSQSSRQCSHAVLMVQPVGFAANPETAASNAFQQPLPPTDALARNAATQFEGLAQALREAGITVVIAEGRSEPCLPDQVFPNNWLTLHADGTAVFYPMQAPSRRAERRDDVFTQLQREAGFTLRRLIDLSGYEVAGRFLEGTGSLVLDRVNHVAYACRAPRTDEQVAADWALRLGYRLVMFDALDADGVPIYHTNVMMSVGSGFALVCAEAISDPDERHGVLAELEASGREVIIANLAQIGCFVGNMLELRAADGSAVIAMSAAADTALTQSQRDRLTAHGRIVSAPIADIEKAGGGSVRCMLAEVFT
ncbi:MAG: amidinotransferase [Gammaproteobacteria bacterium]|nr:amidinotransferase [Gammaproteobacteria bacterium]